MAKTDARRRSFLSFAIRLGLVLIVVIAAVYWLLLADLQRTLKYRLDRLYARGFPRTWQQVVPPPVADDQNAAILYEQAFDRLDIRPEDYDSRSFLTESTMSRAQSYRKPATRALAHNQPVLELLWLGAAKPHCRLPIEWGQTAAEFAMKDSQRSEIRGLRWSGVLLALDAVLSGEQGNTERALRSCRTGIRLSADALGQPTYVYFLSGVSAEASTCTGVARLVQQADLDPRACRLLYEDLQRLALDTSLRRVIGIEGQACLALFVEAERTPSEVREVLMRQSEWNGRGARTVVGLYLSPIGTLWRLKENITAIDLIEDALDSIDMPPPNGVRNCLAEYQLIGSGRVHSVMAARSGWLMGAARAYHYAFAYRNVAQVMLALEAYHTTRGAYPDSLTALRTFPGWKLPVDPFSGRDFRYRRNGAGYVLYGVGEDLDDDGGRGSTRPALDGDWVWIIER